MSQPSYKELSDVIIEEIRDRDRLIEQLAEALDEIGDDKSFSGAPYREAEPIHGALAAYREWKEGQR